MISCDIENFHNFQTSFAFLEFYNHSYVQLWLCNLGKMFEISFNFMAKVSNLAK
jgi:hypothetical protein